MIAEVGRRVDTDSSDDYEDSSEESDYEDEPEVVYNVDEEINSRIALWQGRNDFSIWS